MRPGVTKGTLCSNKLSLNVGKTKFACFHTAQRIVAYPELKINNFIIDRVTEFNFLGLIISSNMKWKKHIDHILCPQKVTGPSIFYYIYWKTSIKRGKTV